MFGAGNGASIFDPADKHFGKPSDWALDDQGGVREQVGVAPNGQVEAFLLLGLDVDVVLTQQDRASLNSIISVVWCLFFVIYINPMSSFWSDVFIVFCKERKREEVQVI